MAKGTVLLAFLLTFLAGFSMTIGALFTFCVSKSQSSILPIALAFSAGVMIYVAFMGILPEGLEAFEEENDNHSLAHLYLALSFIFGIALGYGLDLLSHWLGYEHDHKHDCDHTDDTNNTNMKELPLAIELAKVGSTSHDSPRAASPTSTNDGNEDIGTTERVSTINMHITNDENAAEEEAAEARRLLKMSIIAALAFAVHNLPEGLAAFIATLVDVKLGISITIAVSIHNVPAGISVAMPIYWATGSRAKAIGCAFMSGMFEPIGALIGYAIIGTLFGHELFGVLFGICSGIMLYIAFKEMLPTARKKDPDDRFCSYLLFSGFLVMDLGLILLKAGGGEDEH